MDLLILILPIVGYLLPSLIASVRKHRNANAIFLVNLFFGWTVLGWLVALIWCATDNVEKRPVKQEA